MWTVPDDVARDLRTTRVWRTPLEKPRTLETLAADEYVSDRGGFDELTMKKAALLASVGAALASGVLGHLYYLQLETEVSGGPRVAVLVAAKDIPVGATVAESSLAVREIPQAYVEERQVRAADVKKVLGVRVPGGLKMNEGLLWTDLSTFSDHVRVLSRLVENGMRAVALDGRAASFDGLLRPGDRVDVLFTAASRDDATQTTATLVQNLLVLSVGSNLDRGDANAAPAGGRGTAVSVAASVQQAELLTLSAQRGRLTLTLRNPDDVLVIDGIPAATARELAENRGTLERDPAPQRERVDHVR